MVFSINSKMAVTGETSLKTYRPTPQYSGIINIGEPMELSNRLEILYTLKYENKSKKTKMDNTAPD
jgi:hypothetical protein